MISVPQHFKLPSNYVKNYRLAALATLLDNVLIAQLQA